MNAKLLMSGLNGRDETQTPEGASAEAPILAVTAQGDLSDRIQRQSNLSAGDSVIGMGLAMQAGTPQGLQAFATVQADADAVVEARETKVEGKAAQGAGHAPVATSGEAEADAAHLSAMEQAGQDGASEEVAAVSFDLEGLGDLRVSSGGGVVLGGLEQVAARATTLVDARSPLDENDSISLEATITVPQPGSLLGESGLIGGLLGDDGLVGSILDPVLGEDGLLDSLLGEDGLLDAVLGEDGLVDDLLGQDGIVSAVLDPLLGQDGLVGGLIGGVADGVGDILAPVFGNDGLLDVVIGEDGLLGGILGGDSILDGLLGGSDGGGLLGGLLGGGGAEGDSLPGQIVGTIVPEVVDTVSDTVGAVVDVVIGEDGLLGGILGDDGLLGGLLGGSDGEDSLLDGGILGEDGLVGGLLGSDGLLGGLLGGEASEDDGLPAEIIGILPDAVETVGDTVESVVDVVVGEDGLVGSLLGDEGLVGGLLGGGSNGGLFGSGGLLGGLLGGATSADTTVAAEAAAGDTLEVVSQTDVAAELLVDGEGDGGFLDSLIGGAGFDGLLGDGDPLLDPSQGTLLAGLLGDEDIFGVDVGELGAGADDLFAGLSGGSELTGSLVDQGLLDLSESGNDPEPDAEIDGLLNDILAGGVEDMFGESSAFDDLLGDEGLVADIGGNLGLLDGGAVDDALNVLFDHGADQGSSLLGGLFNDDGGDDGR